MTPDDSIGDALWTFGSRGMALVRAERIMRANERLATWLGEPVDDLRERRLADVFVPEEGDPAKRAAVAAALSEAFEERSSVRLAIGERAVEVSSIALDDDHRLVVCRDATEKGAVVPGASAEVSELQMLRGLAGSLAHDFNNLLSPIVGFTDLLLADQKLSDEQKSQLEQVRIAAERSRYLAAQLLAFGRNQVLKPRPTDLVAAAVELKEQLGRVLRDDIELVVLLPEEACTVMVDPAHLRPMLLNLATSAQDSMPDGGRLTVQIGTRQLNAERQSVNGEATERFGEIVVSDTGEGLGKEARDHLFEPFFTTKGPFGTGLGLASLQGVIQQHGGHIEVQSEPGQGTTFRLYLPLTDAEPESAVGARQATLDLGDAAILLVEDNDLVLKLALKVLTDAGYEVHVAPTGDEARIVLNDEAIVLDLLLTDIVLPDTDGQALAAAATALRPHLNVLYMSGYTNNALADRGILDPTVSFLPKPFSAPDLLTKVREALGRET